MAKTVELDEDEIDLIVGCLVDRQEKALKCRSECAGRMASAAMDNQIQLNAKIQTKLRGWAVD